LRGSTSLSTSKAKPKFKLKQDGGRRPAITVQRKGRAVRPALSSARAWSSSIPLIEQTNAAAYEAYVKGRYFMLQPSEMSIQRSQDFFEQSIAADPGFALAHVGLSNYFGTTDMIAPGEAMPRAKALAYANYLWD
jgi:hypothetical protein